MAIENGNPFFKLEDFRNLEFSIEGTNLTSQVPILKGSSRLIELLDAGICIDVPAKSCSDGHLLSLHVAVKKPVGTDFETVKTQVTGVVSIEDRDSNDRQLVKILFRQYSVEEWNSFLKELAGKQTRANRMIRKTRR